MTERREMEVTEMDARVSDLEERVTAMEMRQITDMDREQLVDDVSDAMAVEIKRTTGE